MYVRYRLTLGGVKRDTWETRSRYSDQCQKLFDVDRLYWTLAGTGVKSAEWDAQAAWWLGSR